jgi:malate dehydrogenase
MPTSAGRTAPAEVGINADRAALAAANLEVFRTYAEALARHGSGREVVIVVTNPVELGVAVMAEVLGRHRVIGMGAWLDTLRFRREIAFVQVDAMPAALRVIVRPSMTHQSGAKTATATAAATVDLVRTVLDGRDIVVAAQVALDGELDGAVEVPGRVQGVPVTLGPEGWKHVLLDPIADDEARLLALAGRSTDGMLETLGVAPPAAGRRVGAAASTPPDVAPGAEPSWSVEIEVVGADGVGTVATLTSVFASRGVAVDSLSTRITERGSDGRARCGVVAITFRAGERRARALVRTLERLAMVRAVVVHEGEPNTAR